jgi:competence protein ComGC
MSNSHAFLGFIISILLLTNVAKVDTHKEQIKQERNDAIVFCVENPNACKAEYLKLR